MPQLAEMVGRMISEEGVKEFVVGRHGNFDHLAAYVCRPGKARDFLEFAQGKNIRIERIEA